MASVEISKIDNGLELQSGSKVNLCSFTEFYDVKLGECVSGMCRTPNTRPDADRYCRQIPPKELAKIDMAASVTDSLRLTGIPAEYDSDAVLSGGRERDKFEQDFIKDLAKQLGVPESMIVVSDIAEGSIIVSFKILPADDETTSSGNASAAPQAPAIVQMSLNSIRQTLSTRASSSGSSLLSYTDPTFGLKQETSESAQKITGAEALMNSFDGSDLEKVPIRTVENPELYSLSPVGLGGREKINEYKPKDRSGVTQDEKWESPEQMDIDVSLFVVPVAQEVTAERLCPSLGKDEDPVREMWKGDGNTDGYGGNFIVQSMEMKQFKRWRIPADRRMKLVSCETADWLEEKVKERAESLGEEFSPEENVYTSANMKDSDCGLPDEFWKSFGCKSMESLSEDHSDQFRASCNRELFPAKAMKYEVEVPFNDKWIQGEERTESFFYKPEWILDFATVYYFTYDKTAEETENAFASKAPAGGDVLITNDTLYCEAHGMPAPCPQSMLYAGKMVFRGQSSGDNKQVLEKTGVTLSQLPASSPAMVPRLTLHLDIDRTVDLIMRGKPQWWPEPEKTREILKCNDAMYNNDENLDNIQTRCRELGIATPPFPYTVDLEDAMAAISSAQDQALSILPGYIYTIDIVLNLQPHYEEDMFGTRLLKTFIISLSSVKGSKGEMSFNHRNQASFRVKFALNNNVRGLLQRPVMPWLSLLTQAGAWMGMWGMAGLMLSMTFKGLRMWGDVGPDDPGSLMDSMQDNHMRKCELRRKKAARKIKEDLEREYRFYNIKVDLEKVLTLLVDPPSTKGLREQVKLVDVLKDANRNAGLHDHISSVLGEVRVQMNKQEDDSEQSDDEELEELERKESLAKGAGPLGWLPKLN